MERILSWFVQMVISLQALDLSRVPYYLLRLHYHFSMNTTTCMRSRASCGTSTGFAQKRYDSIPSSLSAKSYKHVDRMLSAQRVQPAPQLLVLVCGFKCCCWPLDTEARASSTRPHFCHIPAKIRLDYCCTNPIA